MTTKATTTTRTTPTTSNTKTTKTTTTTIKPCPEESRRKSTALLLFEQETTI